MADETGSTALYAEALGSAIRDARKRLKLSATEVARRARVSYSTLHHIERGRAPDLKTLLAVAVAMGVSISELVTSAEGQQRKADEAPIVRTTEPWGFNGEEASISEDQREFLDRLAWAFLRAAHATNRGLTRAILEDLVIACGLAIDQQIGEEAKRAVIKRRA